MGCIHMSLNVPLCRLGTGDLVHKGDTSETTLTDQGVSFDRDVIAYNHHVDILALCLGLFSGKTKVEFVAGVILDDEQGSSILSAVC